MSLIDTHCHIQDTEYGYNIPEVIKQAKEVGVEKMLCVGTDYRTSNLAVELAEKYENIYAIVGIHPHETSKENSVNIERLLDSKKVVAIGEIGLDYYYMHSPKDVQISSFRSQLEIALNKKYPVVFHVRNAFDDFWKIYDEMISPTHKFAGEIHSFTDNLLNLQKALKKGLFIGVNGIVTFAKDQKQLEVYKSIPLDRMLLETDSPYLTPQPFRGTINTPAYCKEIAVFLASLLKRRASEIEDFTTANATKLFNI